MTGSADVPTDTVFRLTFNDYPDPDKVRSDSLLLTTGYFWVPGTYGVDLIGKAAVMKPIRAMSGGLGYGLHVRPGLGSLAGCPGPNEDIEFTTGDGPAGTTALAPPAFSSVQAIFDTSCAGGCHQVAAEDGGGCLAAPAGGLSLCAGEAWSNLVDVASHQSNTLRRVEPGDAARSYLLRKLLPADGTNGKIPGVYGQREPPGDPLPEDQLRLIAAWIDAGALRQPPPPAP